MRFFYLFRTTTLMLVALAADPTALPSAAQTAHQDRSAPDRVVTERNAELDKQFQHLKAEKSETGAVPIVSRIWALWMQSGRSDVDLLMKQAVVAMQVREFDYALAQLDKIIGIAPEYAEGWNKRATVLYLMNEYDRSLADIVETLKREPRHFGALAGRGLIHLARENWKEALEAYRAALAVNPFIQAGSGLIGELERRVGGQEI